MASIEKKFQVEHNPVGFGLSCTADGVSLAGVPLLRRTITGLAPRPMDELVVLMKSAYGHDTDPNRPYLGLEVIAQALNKGDVGRAMVAAIHLRLADLNEEGAAHLAWADEALNKYDPNERRDWRGRWTTGGESPPNNPAKPATNNLAGPAPRKKPARSTHPTKPTSPFPDFAPGGMKPILISDPDEPAGIVPTVSLITNMTLSRDCVHHAHEPNYYNKTQSCLTVMRQCEWLLRINGENSRRKDACMWPDGGAAIMKFGVLVPFKAGHPF